MITAHPRSDTQKKLRALEAQVKRLEYEQGVERTLVAAAREFSEAEQAADELADRFGRGAATETVAQRLAVVDRLFCARRGMRRATGLRTAEEFGE